MTTHHMSSLALDVTGAVGRLTLARPEKLNALNRAALEELVSATEWFDSQPEVKVVIVGGQGRAFSAGFDLADHRWLELGPPEESAISGRAMAEAIAGMRAVTIAAIHGHCIGGGVVLASACDLRLAGVGATFRIPEVDLGVPLYWTGIPRLVREIGPALTKELVLTGRSFGAEEARWIRFVNRVVPDEELDATASRLAAELASKPALVLEVTLRQVEEASPSVPESDSGASADAAGFATAIADDECRAAASSYRRGP